MLGRVLVLFFLTAAFPFFGMDVDFSDLEKGKKIVLATKQIQFEAFPGAHNPSLIKTEYGLLLSFRYTPDRYGENWISYVVVVLLNDQFDPISEPQILSTRPKNSKTPSQSEDARIFSYRNRLFIIYNDNTDFTGPSYWDRRDMFVAELFYENHRFSLSLPLKLVYGEKYSTVFWQKNWVPFEWNKKFMLGYSINPHEVVYANLLNGECYSCYETWAPLNWELGALRGSSAALLVDGEYMAFFHSGKKMTSPCSGGYELWHYFMGAYTFSAEPPFSLTKISPAPLIGEGFYTSSDYEKRVIFPGGFVASGPFIYMAYGKDDREMWIATLDKEELKKSLVPVEKGFHEKSPR